ncbi:hypothetical protein [Pinisolibacter aquiterrae]|uniref:hypothetical protein n=1 Tax=Pinisolibacter aquiterrae TaxID=2815579 RepID=UPI001C3DB88F|nr:hypothetical protein [Pinisolibacter aquiterrae]MBV5265988.1 hypothetical protein [Pinisolibacter aquiterrae]MCC8237155.1 hypothetical protein [Pinisolibacter aquiterrae]
MRTWVATLMIAGTTLVSVSSTAWADRIYSSMEKCNRKCHGVCFMEAEGAHCYWGALKQPGKKVVEPKMKPVRPGDIKPPRN